MIGPEEVRRAAQRKYKDYLSSLVEDTDVFPLEIRFSKVKPGEAAERYASLREEMAALRSGSEESGRPSYHVEWVKRSDRKAGNQTFPARIHFPNATSLLCFLDKEEETERFKADIGIILAAFPNLKLWAARHPERIISGSGDWERIIAVLQWFAGHSRPAVFLREIPAVEDTKFIENNKGILRELLDIVLPAGAVENSVAGFEGRYGLRRIAPTVRLRFLDREISEWHLSGVMDLAVPVNELEKLAFKELRTIIVVENKASFSGLELFLTLPEIRGAAAIFGSGFAAQALRECQWMIDRRILYWGDIDTHGFRILGGLRESFPQIESILMDEPTFDRFPDARSDAPMDLAEAPRGLGEEEYALFLRLARLSSRNRLEQERIPTWWSAQGFSRVLKS
jgi:hypothetical protein